MRVRQVQILQYERKTLFSTINNYSFLSDKLYFYNTNKNFENSKYIKSHFE